LRKAPNLNIQTSEKLQIPSSKEILHVSTIPLKFGGLELIWSLVVGAWNFPLWYVGCSGKAMQTTQNPDKTDSVCPSASVITAEAKSPALKLLECAVPLA
jgi:hypothetical protein